MQLTLSSPCIGLRIGVNPGGTAKLSNTYRFRFLAPLELRIGVHVIATCHHEEEPEAALTGLGHNCVLSMGVWFSSWWTPGQCPLVWVHLIALYPTCHRRAITMRFSHSAALISNKCLPSLIRLSSGSCGPDSVLGQQIPSI